MAETLKVKRTVREILLELPLQKRLQFKEELRRIGNTPFQEALSFDWMEDMYSVVSGLFTWSDSRQGANYWIEIISKY